MAFFLPKMFNRIHYWRHLRLKYSLYKDCDLSLKLSNGHRDICITYLSFNNLNLSCLSRNLSISSMMCNIFTQRCLSFCHAPNIYKICIISSLSFIILVTCVLVGVFVFCLISLGRSLSILWIFSEPNFGFIDCLCCLSVFYFIVFYSHFSFFFLLLLWVLFALLFSYFLMMKTKVIYLQVFTF